MDQVVEDQESLFREVLSHLESVTADTNIKLNKELLRRAQRNVDARSSQHSLWQLLSVGEQTLQTLQQDPEPLCRLLEQVVLSLPFNELRHAVTSDKLEEGLRSPAAPIQVLILAYLKRAADTPSGAGFVAASIDLTRQLLETWLGSASTEVADKALDAITALLLTDSPTTVTASGAQGQGLLWTRIFDTPSCYEQLFEWTSLRSSKHNLDTKQGQQAVTISQGRLYDFIARISPIDWGRVTTSSLADVERKYQVSQIGQPYGGILRYAASDMIDPDDMLMEYLRQDFFVRLLAVAEDKSAAPRMIAAIRNDAGVQAESNGIHL